MTPRAAGDVGSRGVLDRLVDWSLRRPRRILIGWGILCIVGFGLAGLLNDRIVQGGEAPASSGSTEAARALENSTVPSLFLVVEWDAGTSPQARAGALQAIARRVERVPEVTRVGPLPRASGGQRSDRAVVLGVTTRGGFDGAQEAGRELIDERDELTPRADVLVGGLGAYQTEVKDQTRKDLADAERIGLPIVAVVLLLTFGSLWAAALPIMLAISSVAMGLGILGIAAGWADISEYSQNGATLLGLALGVDYTMFLVQRVRERMRAGDERDAAIRTTMRTTGTAVLWSGATVIVAELTMLLIDSRAIRSSASAMALVTLVAVATALLVIPAAFALLGDRLVPRRERRGREGDRVTGWWHAWARRVCRRAPLWLAASTLVLVALTLPLRDLDENVNISSTIALPEGSSVRQAYEDAASILGPGAASPVQVAARLDSSGARDMRQLNRAVRAIAADERVESAVTLPPTRTDQGVTVPILVTPRVGPFAESTRDLVDDLRTGPLSQSLAGLNPAVGGETALTIDAKDAAFGKLPLVMAVLLAFVVAILLFAFRSVFLALKAAVLVVLTLGATLGTLVLLTQTELGSDLIGQANPTDMLPFLPVLTVTIVIALSTDYEVILISRIAENYRRTGNNTESIVEGLGQTGRVITSAGAIMFAIFLGFAFADLPFLKQWGVALALAVLLDATIVRAVLVPAAMQVAGKWNWWWPTLRRVPARSPQPGETGSLD